MKINLSDIDRNQFIVTEGKIADEKVYLVQPQHMGVNWTQQNKIFRSSLWNADGELISAGFPKFPNWGEQSEIFPLPISLKNCTLVEKIDGSLLIVSKYKDQWILRTRGTFDASIHDNGKELEEFKSKYAELIAKLIDRDNVHDTSWLFEWVSPNQRIVLNYGDRPDWYLVGEVYHSDYTLASQKILNNLARALDLKRPTQYGYDMIDEMTWHVGEWKGKEGIVIYSKNDQCLHKVKSTWYLNIHKLKSELSSIKNLVSIWLDWGKPTRKEFGAKITELFDYEVFKQISIDLDRLYKAKQEVDDIICHLYTKLSDWKNIPKKDAALDITKTYGKTIQTVLAFIILNDQRLDDKLWKKLMMEYLTIPTSV